MAEVTGFTAPRMLEIEQSAIIDGEVVGDDLILEPKGFATAPGTYPKINAGNVRGPQGLQGPVGEVTTAAMNAAIAAAHGPGAITETQLDTSSVVTAKIADLAVTEAKLGSSSVTEGKLGAGSVTNAKLADNAVTTAKLANSAVSTAKIASDAVDGSKIADNSINSEHYVDGSIDRVHLAADVIDSSKLANDSVNSEHYVNGSIDEVHLAADSVTASKLDVIAGRSWQTSLSTTFFASGTVLTSVSGVTIPAGSLVFVSYSVDVLCRNISGGLPGIATIEFKIGGVTPTEIDGQALWNGYDTPSGQVSRQTLTRSFMFVAPTTYTSQALEVIGKTNAYNSGFYYDSGGNPSSDSSHTRLNYLIIRA